MNWLSEVSDTCVTLSFKLSSQKSWLSVCQISLDFLKTFYRLSVSVSSSVRLWVILNLCGNGSIVIYRCSTTVIWSESVLGPAVNSCSFQFPLSRCERLLELPRKRWQNSIEMSSFTLWQHDSGPHGESVVSFITSQQEAHQFMFSLHAPYQCVHGFFSGYS